MLKINKNVMINNTKPAQIGSPEEGSLTWEYRMRSQGVLKDALDLAMTPWGGTGRPENLKQCRELVEKLRVLINYLENGNE